MQKANFVAALCCLIILSISCPIWAEPLNALILSGQNNHAWEKTTPVLQRTLEESGRFAVEVLERPIR